MLNLDHHPSGRHFLQIPGPSPVPDRILRALSLPTTVKGRMFRIGHLGDCNDLTLMATLAGVEMGLNLAGVKLAGSGVAAAMDFFATPATQEATPLPMATAA